MSGSRLSDGKRLFIAFFLLEPTLLDLNGNAGPTTVPRAKVVGNVYVTGCGPSASARALQDSGELHSSTERDSSFLRSTPGVVPLVPMHIQELISLSQPVYGQVGDYG